MKTNLKWLPEVSVLTQVAPPLFKSGGKMDVNGDLIFLPGTGGITYNAKIGDPCVGWAADHLEPGVTTRHPDDGKNVAVAALACVGNEARVITGDAKGAKGFVTGKHGGCEHLIIHFEQDVLEKMCIEDKIQVRAVGQGMKLLDWPDIVLRSMSPRLLERMNIREEGGKLKVGVSKMAPACIMGSGLGSGTSGSGDYDLTLFDREITERYGLNDLRFGDIVAILDADTCYGRTYLGGAVTIGVIVHSDCLMAGHGPGVTTLMSCKTALIEPFIDQNANLANFF